MIERILYLVTSRLILTGWLLFPAVVCASWPAFGQGKLDRLRADFDDGRFARIVANAPFKTLQESIDSPRTNTAEELLLYAHAFIYLKRYEDARTVLDKAIFSSEKQPSGTRAGIYFGYAALYRATRDPKRAFEFAQKALEVDPVDRRNLCLYYLMVGKIFFSSGHDLSAIIWLERSENLLDPGDLTDTRLEIYRFLSLAWASKSQYAKAQPYGERLVAASEKTRFKYKYRIGLFELANLKSSSGQKRAAKALFEKGLDASTRARDPYQARRFLSSLTLNHLYEGDTRSAAVYLNRLETSDSEGEFEFEKLLGRGVLASMEGRKEVSAELFSRLAKVQNYSDFHIPYWKSTIATRERDWPELVAQSETLQKLAEKYRFREDLAGIYLNFARAYTGLRRYDEALESARKSIAAVEEMRSSTDTPVSLGAVETYQTAYRLLAELHFDQPDEACALADFLKARVLRDRIDDSIMKASQFPTAELRAKLEILSEKLVTSRENYVEVAEEIDRFEKSATIDIPVVKIQPLDFDRLNKIGALADAAVVSYFFSIDGKLSAFVWRKGHRVTRIQLPVAEDEVTSIARETREKIRSGIFFKKDGKRIFDKLLAPLSLNEQRIIIAPDKILWKIPFQALSPDGNHYLIENTLVSYAPSLATLVDITSKPSIKRRSFKVFANNLYGRRYLSHVNPESEMLAKAFSTQPLLNATLTDFTTNSASSDILHFSMHAELNNEQPLASFLAFKTTATGSGKLTVEDILKLRLRKQSLVFLASCDTDSIVDGEGLVNIAWAMMAAGATSIMSSQWEANDGSTEVFTRNFYAAFLRGESLARSAQSAAIKMIKDKNERFHEPYYWAPFVLLGDHR